MPGFGIADLATGSQHLHELSMSGLIEWSQLRSTGGMDLGGLPLSVRGSVTHQCIQCARHLAPQANAFRLQPDAEGGITGVFESLEEVTVPSLDCELVVLSGNIRFELGGIDRQRSRCQGDVVLVHLQARTQHSPQLQKRLSQ